MIRAVPLALVLLAAALPAALPAQTDQPTDWPKEIERACTHPRYGLRLAASRRVAEGGDAMVPALRAFQREKGRDAILMALVEAIGERSGNGPAVVALLTDWASDRDFYWRGQAMLGLARRAWADEAIARSHRALFAAHLQDPAWLTRAHATFGHVKAGGRVEVEIDADPRGCTRLAILLLGEGDAGRVQDLLDALDDHRTLLGDAWGRRRANESFRSLQTWLGDDFGYRADTATGDNRAAIERIVAAARQKTGADLTAPAPLLDREVAITGGIEVLSCREGDLFLRWGPQGMVWSGLDVDPRHTATIPTAAFEPWAARHAAISNEPQQGVVICDKLRLKWDAPLPALHFTVAPDSLPTETAGWLKDLAALIEEAGEPALATALRARLSQFAKAASGG